MLLIAAVVLVGCSLFSPSLDVIVSNEGTRDLEVKLVNADGVVLARDAVSSGQEVRFGFPSADEWELLVGDQRALSSATYDTSEGPIVHVVIREDGSLDVRQVAEG